MLDIKESLADREAVALDGLVREIMGSVFVEIGSWKGHSASIIGAAIKEKGGHLYCVDHWKGNEATENVDLIDGDNIYRIFEHNMKSLELWDTITPIKKDSLTASKDFDNGSIDFLFLDADHRYEPFTRDLHAWYPKMKRGGIMCGHDCEQFYSNLTEAGKRLIDNSLYADYVEQQEVSCHPGIIRGLYDCFGDDYGVIDKTRIWVVGVG